MGKPPSSSPFNELYAKYGVDATPAPKSQVQMMEEVRDEQKHPLKKKNAPVPEGNQQKKGKKERVKPGSDGEEPHEDGAVEEPKAKRQKVEENVEETKTESRAAKGKPSKYVKSKPVKIDGSMLGGGG